MVTFVCSECHGQGEIKADRLQPQGGRIPCVCNGDSMVEFERFNLTPGERNEIINLLKDTVMGEQTITVFTLIEIVNAIEAIIAEEMDQEIL